MYRLIWVFAGHTGLIVGFVMRWLSYYLKYSDDTADFSFLYLNPLTLVLLNPDIPAFANSVDPDQLTSEEANWCRSALFAIKYVNL